MFWRPTVIATIEPVWQKAAAQGSTLSTRHFGASCLAHSSSDSTTSSRIPRRSSRFSVRPGADLVGLPDSLSNLRPVKYGSAFEEEQPSNSSSDPQPFFSPSSSSSSSSPVTMSFTHPYSLNEFNHTSSFSLSWSLGKRNRRGHSLYFEKLLNRLEEAELAHKLRRTRADNFNQRFWQDNNARFIQALSEFRSRTPSTEAVATLSKQEEQNKPNNLESELDIDSDSLATFYSAWLKANSTRHRAYNRQLWTQTFGDLVPASRYQALRTWAKVVGAVERKLGRGL